MRSATSGASTSQRTPHNGHVGNGRPHTSESSSMWFISDTFRVPGGEPGGRRCPGSRLRQGRCLGSARVQAWASNCSHAARTRTILTWRDAGDVSAGCHTGPSACADNGTVAVTTGPLSLPARARLPARSFGQFDQFCRGRFRPQRELCGHGEGCHLEFFAIYASFQRLVFRF